MKENITKFILKAFLFAFVLTAFGCGGQKVAYQRNKIKLQDIDYGFQVKYAQMGGKVGNIAYVDEGQGEYTLLFLHGIASSLKYFYYQIKYLKQFYRVIAVDMPGYGKSTNDAATNYNYMLHLAAMNKFIKKLDLKNLIIVGHSYGGIISLGLADANKNDRLKKLVLIAPGALQKFNSATVSFVRTNMGRLVEAASRVEYDPDKYIEEWHTRLVYRRTPITDSYLKERLGLIFSRDVDKVAATRNKVIKFAYSTTGRSTLLGRYLKFSFPILIIAGDKDGMIPIAEAPSWARENPETFWKRVASKNPNTKLKIIKDCGHMPVIEYPEAVNKAIRDFLN